MDEKRKLIKMNFKETMFKKTAMCIEIFFKFQEIFLVCHYPFYFKIMYY